MRCSRRSSCNSTKGFSLIEVLVVLVIIGVLASLAIPTLSGNKGEAIKAEALNALGTIRRAQLQYFSLNQTYLQASSDAAIELGLRIQLASGGQAKQWDYFCVVFDRGNKFSCQAVYSGSEGLFVSPTNRIVIRETGDISDTTAPP
jgi:prepilin-type N-terminal cleavage/methylation domain-containing protein